MTFQYFFFDTYLGDFLQVIPVALAVGLIYGIFRFRRDHTSPVSRKLLASLFVCYLTGLLALTLVPPNFWVNIWYYLFYRQPSGNAWHFFNFTYRFIPTFLRRFTTENLFNLLMFLPFGLLHPFFSRQPSFGKTFSAGLSATLAIELLQPLIGRSFDMNDLILNTLGVLISTSLFFLLKRMLPTEKKKS